MSRQADFVVTICVLLSVMLAGASCILAFTMGVGWACVTFMAACYLVLLAMFVVEYVGRDDGR